MNTVMSTDTDTLRRILYDDPVWAAYAIADLQPAYVEQCRWFTGGCGPHGECTGLVMLYTGLEPPVLFATGPAAAVEESLAAAAAAGALPPTVYLSILCEHEAAVGRWYALAGRVARADLRPMLRLVLRKSQPLHLTPAPGLVRLHGDDAPRMERLYALGGDFAPDAFVPAQLADGVFYGVEQRSAPHELLAAGGTHIVDWDAGVAAIGNFYTRADARRKGMAGLLLAAIVHDLRAANVDTIVLNVDERNANAGRLYERYGFALHTKFIEGAVARK